MELLEILLLGDVIYCLSVVPSYFLILERYEFEQDIELKVKGFVEKCLDQMYDLQI